MLTIEEIINIAESKETQVRLRNSLITSYLGGDGETSHTHLREAYENRNPGSWGAIYVNFNPTGDFYLSGRGEYEGLELEIINELKEEELCCF